jgi:OOP family OmpA-OmpF porin
MRTLLFAVLVGILAVFAGQQTLYSEEDVEGGKDHPLLSRMNGYYIYDYVEQEYDSHEFYDDADKEYIIEGHMYAIYYSLEEGHQSPGQLNVVKNYTNAIRGIGGTILREGTSATMKVVKDGMETWVDVWADSYGNDYTLTIVEKKLLDQQVVADPKAMAGDIMKEGHVAVYGIYFDTDSDKIKPESDPTIKAIADMLKANPSLKVYVVGHTDMTGTLEHNMDLSSRRAVSVMNELVSKYGITATRLKSKGVGPLCPVASNKTEDGRAKNRRVELVEM